MRNSLKSRILLTVVVIILFFGSLSAALVFVYSRNTVLDIQKQNLQNISIEQSHELEILFDSIVGLSDTLSKQKKVIDYVLDEERTLNDESILEVLNYYNVSDSFLSSYIIDYQGNTLASTDESFVGKNYFFRDYFENAIRGQESVEVALGVTSKELGYYFSSPIFDYNGNVVGVSVFKASPEIVNDPLERFAAETSSNIMLVDKFGVVVFSDSDNRLFSLLAPLDKDEMLYMDKERTYEGVDFKVLDYTEVKENLKHVRTSNLLELYDDIDQENEIISVARVGNFPFYVLLEEETDRYIGQNIRTAVIISSVVLLASIVALFLIFFILSRMLSPLKKITIATKEIKSGNYDYKLDIKTGDELEELSSSFNDMSSELKSVVASIEKEVEDRTKKLSKINKMMLGREKRIAELKKQIKNK
ncbi:hypothetical protein C0580_03490 [Candidatus Parcubacteria bacterium]|nr:MAG: hypothetical protein C0580_03490 [Candidatus Parcubacteria bacterium]